MEPVKKSSPNTALVILFLAFFIVAIGSCFYTYYYTKNYDYLVEAACDTNTENCFERDCENDPDSCPPNGLSSYKKYYVKAYDFKQCSDNSCIEQCNAGEIWCEEIVCDPEVGDVCSTTLVE